MIQTKRDERDKNCNKMIGYQGMWNLPGPGIEPVSPVLAGRFLIPGPQRKSCCIYFFSGVPCLGCRFHEGRKFCFVHFYLVTPQIIAWLQQLLCKHLWNKWMLPDTTPYTHTHTHTASSLLLRHCLCPQCHGGSLPTAAFLGSAHPPHCLPTEQLRGTSLKGLPCFQIKRSFLTLPFKIPTYIHHQIVPPCDS